VFQVDIPLDPAPRAALGLATNRAKRRPFAAPALLVFHIHIPWHAAPAAPERLLGAGAGKKSAFFAANGALGHVLGGWDLFLFYIWLN
jgi:hypothetical protein